MTDWKRPSDEELWKLREEAAHLASGYGLGSAPGSFAGLVLSTIPPKPKPKKVERWMNVYVNGAWQVYSSPEEAVKAQYFGGAPRLRIVRLIEAEEGE